MPGGDPHGQSVTTHSPAASAIALGIEFRSLGQSAVRLALYKNPDIQ